MLGVLSRAGVVQAAGGGAGQSEGVVEFPVGEESSVAGDGRAVELQLDLAVEVYARGVHCGCHPLGSSVVSAEKGQKRWVFQGFGANVMPKAEVHLGNVGLRIAE